MKSGYSWTELVGMAIEIERSGEKFYRGAAKKVGGGRADSFRSLADAERRHAEIFHSLLPKGVGEGTKGISPDEAGPYLEALVSQALLGYLRECEHPTKDLATPKEILEFALGFEDETIKFYQSLEEHVTGAAGPVLGKVIAEEKRHREQIGAMLTSLPA